MGSECKRKNVAHCSVTVRSLRKRSQDGSILLNKNQTVPQDVYSYRLRYRYYYNIVPQANSVDTKVSAVAVAAPVETFVASWWTEHLNNECVSLG